MKKISLFKSLALLGAVGLTSVCVVETALLLKDKKGGEINTTGDAINLNTYSGYTLAEEIKYDEEPSGSEIKDFLQNNGIQLTTEEPFKFSNINDLDVVVDSTTKTFSVIAKNNSSDYVGNSVALIHYATPTKTAISSIIGTSSIAYVDNKFEDEDLTKSNILNSLKSSFPALNINHLVLELNDVYGQEGSAIVSVKQGSSLYVGDPIGITYNTSGSVTMTLDKNVIAQGQTATPTFKYHGITPPTGVTYSCSAPSTNFAFSTTTGVLTYTSGNTADFLGGAYSINASYTTGGNTYTASQIVFAQSNIQYGSLTIPAPNISLTNLNSGTPTFKVNGATVTANLAYTISPAVPSGQGLSFASGKLTWDGATSTNGGIFTITGTYSGTGIKTTIASAQVFVSQCNSSEFNALGSDVLTTKTGFVNLFTRAGCVDPTHAFARYRANISSSIWAPIATVLNTSRWIWAECYIDGNDIRMEVTYMADPGIKYTLDANLSGDNLTWVGRCPSQVSQTLGYFGAASTIRWLTIPFIASNSSSIAIELNLSLEASKDFVKFNGGRVNCYGTAGTRARLQSIGYMANARGCIKIDLSYAYSTQITLIALEDGAILPVRMELASSQPAGYTWTALPG